MSLAFGIVSLPCTWGLTFRQPFETHQLPTDFSDEAKKRPWEPSDCAASPHGVEIGENYFLVLLLVVEVLVSVLVVEAAPAAGLCFLTL